MILVAGGTGRLGSLVVRRLADRALPVRVLTRDASRAAHLIGPGVEVMIGDVRDASSLVPAFVGATTVVSAVQGLAGPGRVSPATVDRDGNAHLVDAARAAQADVVLMSIVGAAPDSPMELFRMKYAAELYLRSSGVASTVVRATAFLELWVQLLERTSARTGRPVVLGRGENPINFVGVDDVAAVVERAVIDPSTRGATLQVGGPDNLTLNELAAAVQTEASRSGRPVHVPLRALRLLARSIGRLRPELGRQLRMALAMDHVDLTFDSTPIRQAYPDLPRTSLHAAVRSLHLARSAQ